MKRTTFNTLEALARTIAHETGHPSEPYTKTPDGGYTPIAGALYIDSTGSGGYALAVMLGTGGQRIEAGPASPSELAGILRGVLAGVRMGKGSPDILAAFATLDRLAMLPTDDESRDGQSRFDTLADVDDARDALIMEARAITGTDPTATDCADCARSYGPSHPCRCEAGQ